MSERTCTELHLKLLEQRIGSSICHASGAKFKWQRIAHRRAHRSPSQPIAIMFIRYSCSVVSIIGCAWNIYGRCVFKHFWAIHKCTATQHRRFCNFGAVFNWRSCVVSQAHRLLYNKQNERAMSTRVHKHTSTRHICRQSAVCLIWCNHWFCQTQKPCSMTTTTAMFATINIMIAKR